ncbi:MAG: TolC family protein, partial [Spirochaetes bacterium]|nr:TolC family protein [Spirochaetota bacterium]
LESVFSEKLKLDLITAQNLAVNNNIEHHISHMKHKLMKSSYLMGFSSFFPQFNTRLTLGNRMLYNVQDYTTRLYSDPYSIELTLGVDQLLFDGGVSISKVYFKYYEISLLGKELEEKEQAIRTEIESIYANVIFLQSRVEEQKKNLELLRSKLTIREKNLELELITQLEYQELLIQVLEAEINLSTDKRKFDFALHELKQLINVESDVELVSKIEIRPLEVKPDQEEFFIHKTLMNNSKSNTLKLAKYKSRAQQVSTYLTLCPKVSMNFSYTFEGENFPLKRKEWSLGFNFNWQLPAFPINITPKIKYPLEDEEYEKYMDKSQYQLGELETSTTTKYFHQPQSINKFQDANIEFYKSHLELEKYIKNTNKTMKQTLKEYNELVKLYSLNLKRIELLEEKLKILLLKKQLGEARLIDIIESENSLFSSRIKNIDIGNQIYKKIITIKNMAGVSTEEFYEAII